MNNHTKGICGIILASEIADMPRAFKDNCPRSMLTVGNKPVIMHQIEFMREAGIKDIFIVVKHNKEKIISFFENGAKFGVKITYVEQEQALGIAHVIGQLEKHVNTPFILSLGNTFFISRPLIEIIESAKHKNASGVLITQKTEDRNFDGLYFGMVLHESGMVKRVIEKPRYMYSPYKGCGLYYFHPVIFDAIRRTPRTAMRDKYEITDSIQILIDDGYPVYQSDSISWYRHIIIPEDLILCNKKHLETTKHTSP